MPTIMAINWFILTGSGAVAYHRSYFGTRSSSSFISSDYCYGSPSRILDCGYSVLATVSCGQAAHVGVLCISRLIGIYYECSMCLTYLVAVVSSLVN